MPPTTSDERTLSALLHRATDDLHASAPIAPTAPTTLSRRRRRPPALLGAAVAAAAAAAVVTALVAGGTPVHPTRSITLPGTSGPSGPAGPTGPAHRSGSALVRLAAAVTALPAPSGRYAVEIERQTEGTTSYLKATVADGRTGTIRTYQRGAGVPATLPDVSGPTQAQVNDLPADPSALRASLAAAAAGDGVAGPGASGDAAVFAQATTDLWQPLLEPPQRAALLRLIDAIPGVVVDAHATDAAGRPSIETSYRDGGTGTVTSVYLDPANGFVDETSTSGVGSDVYLSLTRTDQLPPDPLAGLPVTTPSAGRASGTDQAPQQTAHPVSFQSPSGNISCQIAAAAPAPGLVAYCQTVTPPRSVTLMPGRAPATCTGVQCLGNPPNDVTTLAYGTSVTDGPYTCDSTTAGIRCTVGRSGFVISRSGVTPVG